MEGNELSGRSTPPPPHLLEKTTNLSFAKSTDRFALALASKEWVCLVCSGKGRGLVALEPREAYGYAQCGQSWQKNQVVEWLGIGVSFPVP